MEKETTKGQISFFKWLLSLIMFSGCLIYVAVFYCIRQPSDIGLMIIALILLPAPMFLHMEWSERGFKE